MNITVGQTDGKSKSLVKKKKIEWMNEGHMLWWKKT